jgi:quinol-cytochrome oxidoreductase complex cytochrome b subunit
MKYYWILKYILYSSFSRKNLIAIYQEGGAFGVLLLMPYLSYSLFVGNSYKNLDLIIGLIIIVFDILITWNLDKVYKQYDHFDRNKHSMQNEFNIVRWFIVIDIGLFILSALYRTAIRSGWI